jgi:anti-anti-sigma factor
MSNTPYRLSFDGEVNIFTAAESHSRLLAALAEGEEIEVDISLIREVDAAGLQLMVAAKLQAAAQNKSLRFVGYSLAVSQILKLCDLQELFDDSLLLPKAEHA